MSFQSWMQELDERCRAEFLLSIYDLPDMDFWYAYESGLSPKDFLDETIPDLGAFAKLVLD